MNAQGSLPFMGGENENYTVETKESKIVMAQEEKLGRLEVYIEKLIGNYNELKKEYETLQSQYDTLEKENKEKQNLLGNLQSDKSVMHDRVTGLIDKIEEWESSLGSPSGKSSVSKKKRPRNESAVTSEQTFSLGVE